MPMVAFQESSKEERRKYRISMADGSVMRVVAVWDYRRMDDGSNLVSCAMVTCEPNELASILEPMDARLMTMECVGELASARKAKRRSATEEQETLFAF